MSFLKRRVDENLNTQLTVSLFNVDRIADTTVAELGMVYY